MRRFVLTTILSLVALVAAPAVMADAGGGPIFSAPRAPDGGRTARLVQETGTAAVAQRPGRDVHGRRRSRLRGRILSGTLTRKTLAA